MSEHGSTHEGDPAPEPRDDAGEAQRPAVDANLSELQARLNELQQSVEELGSQGHWPVGAAGAAPEPPQAPEPEPAPYAPPPYAPEPPAYDPTGFEPPAPDYAQAPDPYASQHPGPPEPPAPPYRAPEPDPLTYPAPPAATNGHGTESVDPAEISARSATVAIVDAGPFADLIELRHFEDDLAALEAVRDVRVRRFGQSRASIEVGMTGPYALGRELYQLNRPMEIGDGPEGEFVIELEPLPQQEPALEPEPDDAERGD